MQAPTIIFDHVNNTVAVLTAGPASEHKLAEMAATQRDVVSTSGPTKS